MNDEKSFEQKGYHLGFAGLPFVSLMDTSPYLAYTSLHVGNANTFYRSGWKKGISDLLDETPQKLFTGDVEIDFSVLLNFGLEPKEAITVLKKYYVSTSDNYIRVAPLSKVPEVDEISASTPRVLNKVSYITAKDLTGLHNKLMSIRKDMDMCCTAGLDNKKQVIDDLETLIKKVESWK